jgi:spoIIIJ-associated protein
MSQVSSIEVAGATVDAAVQDGLAKLGLTRDRVTIAVLREASRGVLGIGARDAVVRLTEIELEEPPLPGETPLSETTVETTSDDEGESYAILADLTVPTEAPLMSAPASARQRYAQQEILEMARQVLADLLVRMEVQAEIEPRIVQSKVPGEDPSLILDMQGKDLGFLIGRQGETLAALQHLLRLIVNKSTEQRANLIVDVEGYKLRRERALQKLALRIADQATRRNRRVALEPMSAYERRIIHMTLRNHPTVATESVGEGDQRKVTILPKQSFEQ